MFTYFNPLSLSECNKYTSNLLNRSHLIFFRTAVPLVLLILGTACSPTRRLAEGDYLLYRSDILIKDKSPDKAIDKTLMEPYRKQSPNKSILGVKFHLFVYNLANPGKENWINNWLRKIGEEPVIWNPVLTERTTEQFKSYLEAKGFYENKVVDSVELVKGRAHERHFIELNEPHLINTIDYEFEDQGLKDFILADTSNSLVRVGDRFDKEVLQLERERTEIMLKNLGFYRFSKELILYEAFEKPGKKLIDLKIIFKENVTGLPDPVTKVKHHYQYKINSVQIYPDYSETVSFLKNKIPGYDTVRIDHNLILYKGRRKIKQETLLIPNRCNPGQLYRLSDVKKTYTGYSSIGLFRVINIHFNELKQDYSDTAKYEYLDCIIELTPRKPQSYQMEFVGTHSAGDFGGRANFVFTNYNLLRGAENFQVKITGAVEDVSHRIGMNESGLNLMKELGVESTLSLPKFLVPFKATRFTKKYSPKTLLNVSYNFQDRPDYIRTIAKTSMSYRWKSNPFITHQFYPFEFNYVELPKGILDPELEEDVMGTPQETSFKNHTILATRYNFEYTNQVLEKKTDFMYLRTSIESSGNLINLFSNLASTGNDSTFLNVPYFRYLKGDVNLIINDQINARNNWVYRIYAGVGYPIGRSDVLPFEKMYYGGGPSGVRGWKTGELGPGSDNCDTVSYASKLGDIKLEGNVEYRFKLFWKLEGAWFVDAGNVWLINETRPGTGFRFNRFYKEIAVGTGLGARFDFSFLIIRLDMGFKLRDPSLEEGHRWIDFNRTVEYPFNERFNFLFGIGYPF
jgi:outer membrane protein assembly factor BamA